MFQRYKGSNTLLLTELISGRASACPLKAASCLSSWPTTSRAKNFFFGYLNEICLTTEGLLYSPLPDEASSPLSLEESPDMLLAYIVFILYILN